MKVRLVKLGTNEYSVQTKYGILDSWSGSMAYTLLKDAMMEYEREVNYYTNKKNRKVILEVLKQTTI